MDLRNAVFTKDGEIDCEIKHPEFGWIPFTATHDSDLVDGDDVWTNALDLMPAPYIAPVIDPVAVLVAERAGMVVSRLQAIAALHYAGLLPMVEAAMAKADFITALAWKEAAEFRRTSPMMDQIAQALGLNDAVLDLLFRTGATIEF
jgi:hypothetical protein